MERLPKARVATATLVLLFSGCSAIQENNEIAKCNVPDGTMIEATTDPNQTNYQPATDPAILTAKLLDEAKSTQESDNHGWDITLRNQVVGIGKVACEGSNGQLYLTNEGTRLSVNYQEHN